MWHGADSCDLIEFFDVNLLLPFLLWPGKKTEFRQSVAREKKITNFVILSWDRKSYNVSFSRSKKVREVCQLIVGKYHITKFTSPSQKNRKICPSVAETESRIYRSVAVANRSRENITKFDKQSWKNLAKFIKRARKNSAKFITRSSREIIQSDAR